MGESSLTEPRNIVPIQLKNLTPVGTEMSKRHDGEERQQHGAGGVHVVRPNTHGQAADRQRGEDHALVTEHGLAGEGRDDLGCHPEEGQRQDVDLGMAEEPEQVLPQDRLAAPGRVEEVRPHVPVGPEQDEVGGEHGEGQQHQKGGDKLVPGEYGHAEHDHPGRPQAEHRRYQVDAGEHAGESGQRHPHDPQVASGAGEWMYSVSGA